jgi:hypothetical protein
MPDKHPNTHRWGGPGSSHEDRNKPEPVREVDPRAPGATNDIKSRVSGGGGERDIKHSHIDDKRSSKNHHQDHRH